ncbi:MAG: GGDEF domain-containing protein [Acidobacteria bacterium]|nr:GGDEF domain-containing protein [Acidobacteriota bacterium]
MLDDTAGDAACQAIIGRIREEIVPLFDRAIRDEKACFQNPHLIHCLQKKTCTREVCPAYHDEAARCWQIAGTYCGGDIQGSFADKYQNCRACDVFLTACPTIVEELGENLNNLLFLLRKEKRLTRSQIDKIEYLNRELLSSLENLDTRNREIQELVVTDKLTGLYNRHYLMTSLEDEIDRCQRRENRFALMMIDVDNFKSINDDYGHSSGDAMLACLGGLLRKQTRKHDRPFRYGGEEFVVILPDTDLTIAWVVAERIRTTFEKEQITVETKDAPLTAVSRTLSIGLARYEQGLTPEALLMQADDAMYRAKSQGKNRVIKHGVD